MTVRIIVIAACKTPIRPFRYSEPVTSTSVPVHEAIGPSEIEPPSGTQVPKSSPSTRKFLKIRYLA